MVGEIEVTAYDVMVLGIVADVMEYPSALAPLSKVVELMPLRIDRVSPFIVLATLVRRQLLVKGPRSGIGFTRMGWVFYQAFLCHAKEPAA